MYIYLLHSTQYKEILLQYMQWQEVHVHVDVKQHVHV